MKNIYLALVSILLFASCGQEPASEIENRIKVGSLGFHVSFVVPNDATERMDQFIKTHEQFMRVENKSFLNKLITNHKKM